ncbi:MAG: prepilin-type N-terminal cleavage/methylation domain-containing protein [Kiritimatiellia bacterium]
MKRTGFTLVEIMIVVAIIGLLAAIAIPSFMKARETSRQNACINNLRQIKGAKQQAALELNYAQGKAFAADSEAETNMLSYIENTPICPSDEAQTYATSYTTHDLGTSPECQINTDSRHVIPGN